MFKTDIKGKQNGYPMTFKTKSRFNSNLPELETLTYLYFPKSELSTQFNLQNYWSTKH